MEWKSAATSDDGSVSIPERWLHLHYYEALNILFRMENALRMFTYVVLKAHFQEKWADAAITGSEGNSGTITSIAAKRLAQAKRFGYLGYEISSPLMYMNSGELTHLILSDTYWSVFKPHFLGNKEIIRTKLDEIGTVRNSLAHFRPITYDDIELIKQNIKHAFIGIERCLSEMTETHRVVPTNTDGAWYQSIAKLDSDRCSVRAFQSLNENWIRLQIDYSCAILRSGVPGAYRHFISSNLISPQIIARHKGLARHSIYMTELVPFAEISINKSPSLGKYISVTFSSQSVREHHEEISSELKDILTTIDEETEALQRDSLARGTLVDSARISIRLEEKKESSFVRPSELKCEFTTNDPPEYWGEIARFKDDFIAGATKYPWMPSDISKEDLPF